MADMDAGVGTQGAGISSTAVYIDAADGLKRVMNNKKLYVKLLNKFKDEPYVHVLKEAVAAGDRAAAQIAAHTIKGLAANLSLPELYNQALDVESRVKNQSSNPETLNPGVLSDITACYVETLKAIDKVLQEYGG